MIYPLIGIICITLIGFIAHRLGLCLVSAVKLLTEGKPGLLLAILMSGLWVGAYSVLAYVNEWEPPFVRFQFHFLFALGGFIFGVGAAVNQGCSVSTMHKFASGNLSMLFTMVGWFVGLCVWLSLTEVMTIHYQASPQLQPDLVILIFALSIVFTVLMMILLPQERARWLGISMIGLLVGVLFYIEPMWAPSRLIQDIGSALFQDNPLPSLYRILLVMMLLLGMWWSLFTGKNLNLRWPTMHKIMRRSIAGLMMGFGGAMALGGNDSQILTGLPTLSMGAIIAVLFMLIGIATEQVLYRWRKSFYELR